MTPVNVTTVQSLQRDVADAVDSVRSAVTEILTALPAVQRPTEFQRVLGIDYTMSWKLMRIAEATDPLEVAIDVPRPGSMSRMLTAMATYGIDESLGNRLEDAVIRFDELAKQHGPDRATFDAMISAWSPDAERRAMIEARRAAFRANTRILGNQIEAMIATMIVRPCESRSDVTDLICVSSYLRIKRFHTSAPLRFMSNRFAARKDSGLENLRAYSLDGTTPFDESPLLLTEFCTDPLPPVKMVNTGDGGHYIAFDRPEIGVQSSVDCVTAAYIREAQPSRDHAGRPYVYMSSLPTMPVAVHYIDFFVHRELAPQPAAEAMLFRDQTPEDPMIAAPDPTLLLPLQEEVNVIGRGFRAARCREMPRYSQLLSYVFDQVGSDDADDFTLVRLRVEYPVRSGRILLRLPIALSNATQ